MINDFQSYKTILEMVDHFLCYCLNLVVDVSDNDKLLNVHVLDYTCMLTGYMVTSLGINLSSWKSKS